MIGEGRSTPLAAGVGNSNDQTRRHNLSTILTLLHHGGAKTRAELTRRTGLNRSTIAALVGELAERGLVFETQQTDPGTVGRPSPFVNLNDHVTAIAVNPDLDAVTVGLVGLGGVVHERVRHETAGIPSVSETVDIVATVVRSMLDARDDSYRVVGVGLAVPGLVRTNDGVVTLAPHLLWTDEPLAAPMAAALGLPAEAANDASIGMVAESVYGAGRDVEHLIYLNGSTSGIGGGVLVGGRPLRGADGYAGELGHTLVNSVGETCFCGKIGCLETEVSLARLLAVLGVERADADELDALIHAASTAETADATVVMAEIDRQLDVLAVALGNFIGIFNPQVIVLGGFLGSLFAANPSRLTGALQRSTFGSLADGVRVERAQLRSRLLMVGAAELAFALLLGDPASFGQGAEPGGE